MARKRSAARGGGLRTRLRAVQTRSGLPLMHAGTARRADRRTLLSSTAWAALVGIVLFSFADTVAAQLRIGGGMVGGSATITQDSSTLLTINQSTNRGVIDWQSFNVGVGARVNFQQPGATSVTLNRVVGPDPSLIAGQISANGQIVLINPSGITFANGAQVNVHSLIASTANVANAAQFMQGGRIAFDQPSANPGASVVNQGTITVGQGGLVGLVGPNSANNGVINARLGRVVIGGADTMTVDLAGDGFLELQIGQTSKTPTTASNTGLVDAQGGSVAITAAAARAVVGSMVNAGGSCAPLRSAPRAVSSSSAAATTSPPTSPARSTSPAPARARRAAWCRSPAAR